VLLASGDLFGIGRHLDLSGVGFAMLAGACWAVYILMSKETGKRFPGTVGLAGAMAIAALLVAPLGVLHAGRALLRPEVLGIGLAVAVLSSALPYRAELAALRRSTPRAFGVLLSMAPALAALAGLAVLGQHLSTLEVVALVLVVAANAGSTWTGGRSARGGLGARNGDDTVDTPVDILAQEPIAPLPACSLDARNAPTIDAPEAAE
jgi:inner membrane transporter RhtA